jgi:hypothetical protein
VLLQSEKALNDATSHHATAKMATTITKRRYYHVLGVAVVFVLAAQIPSEIVLVSGDKVILSLENETAATKSGLIRNAPSWSSFPRIIQNDPLWQQSRFLSQ